MNIQKYNAFFYRIVLYIMTSLQQQQVSYTPDEYINQLSNVALTETSCTDSLNSIYQNILADKNITQTNINKISNAITEAETRANANIVKIATGTDSYSGAQIAINNSKDNYNDGYNLNVALIIGICFIGVVIYKIK